MASVTAILQQAQSADFATRSAAEQELLRLEASDYGAFVTELATLLANEEAPVDVRQLAAILLKNSVASRGGADGAGVAERWRAQVSAGQRTAVHEALLEALGSVRGGTPVRRQVAQALAKVAGLDLPTGAWPELIERLVQPMLQPGDGYARRHGSVEALGFLSEEGALAEVLSRWSDAILTAVVQGMRGGGEAPTTTPANKEVLAVQRAATGALFNALAFVAHNFENERERDIIMLTVMAAAASPADWGLRRDAFECLVGIASRYYDKLALRSPGSNNLTYIELLFQLTLEAIQNDCDEVAMQAIEFWSTVADEEASRLEEAALHLSNAVCLRIVEQAVAPLLPVLLQSMVRNGDGADGHAAADEDDAEQVSWNKAAAAGTCVALMAQAAPDAVLQLTVPFVRENSQAQVAWPRREAAMLAIGSVVAAAAAATSDPKSASLLPEVLPLPLQALETDPHEAVRDTAAWSIGRTFQRQEVVDLESTLLRRLVQALTRSLQDVPRVARSACYALSSIAEATAAADAAADAAAPTGVLSPFAVDLADALLGTAARQDADEYRLMVAAYEAFISLLQSVAEDAARQLLALYFSEVMRRLEASLSAQQDGALAGAEMSPQVELQGMLCGVLQALVHRSDAETLNGTADRVMTAVLRVLGRNASAAVHEDALMAAGSVASVLEAAFGPYAEHIMPYVLAGLRNWQAYQLCVVAVGVTCDLCRSLGRAIEPYADATMEAVFMALSNNDLNRSVKPPMIGCIGDMALAIEGAFERHLDVAMNMLRQAALLSVQMPVSDDDTNDWILDLRQNTLEAYTGVINGLKSDGKAMLLVERGHVEWVVHFCERVQEEVMGDEDLLRSVAGVLGDIAQTFGPQASAGIRRLAWARTLLETLRNTAQKRSTRETADWAYQLLYA
ncbi:hypothetical protein CDCA_CDCA15G4054 [Cyanidium caldarium]|uniref:Importin N-terminal domain-containing protein n=1 Tax=Cyanidium caldarium TaxID=2771 RepID=A0AAV9J0G0_CYACA|nr:hypothetical protein CDCA_CDCA15G4054 [Cyanidium caldarium]